MKSTSLLTARLSAPRGMSILEFFGCLVALGCGVVLGSLYLGIDVQAVAVQTLNGETPSVETGDNATSSESATSDEQTPAGSDNDSPESRSELAEPVVGDDANAVEADATAPPSEPVDAAATRNYWDALTAAIDREANSRVSEPRANQGWQLFDYILGRRDAHTETVADLEQLAFEDVDPRLVDFADRVTAWHQRGADLYGRAADLLTDSGRSDLRGPVAQSWQSAATQHRMEERLLLQRRQTLEQVVQRWTAAGE